jgi:HEAT repeat protein
MYLDSPEPILLNDEQMREFIANGYVILRPNIPDEVNRTIDEKFDFIDKHEFNPGNNIIPRIPELEWILRRPEVHGGLISVLGENFLVHPHRYWHMLPPREGALSKEEVSERVFNNCHQDQYSPSSQPRSHRTRYARLMYYPHETPVEIGPTHVLPGTQYHDIFTNEDRDRTSPVHGDAGLVFLSHFDIGHSAGVNLQNRRRHMVKFIFMRAEEPEHPSWDSEDGEWSPPEELSAPYDLNPAWQSMWNWHCGRKSVSLPPPAKPNKISRNIQTLTGDVSVEEKLSALTELAKAGPEAAEATPVLIDTLQTAHQALRTAAIYTLASFADPPLEALCRVLKEAGERASHDENPPDHDHRWITLHDAAYALGAMGAPAVGPLSRLLGSPFEWTRMNAAFALGEMGPEAVEAVPALEAALRDESHYVIRLAANSLGEIGSGTPAESLSRLLSADAPGWDEEKNFGWTVRNAVNVTAAIALARLGHRAANSEDALLESLRDPFDQVGFLAVQALNRIGTDSARQAIIDDLISHRWDTTLSAKRSF